MSLCVSLYPLYLPTYLYFNECTLSVYVLDYAFCVLSASFVSLGLCLSISFSVALCLYNLYISGLSVLPLEMSGSVPTSLVPVSSFLHVISVSLIFCLFYPIVNVVNMLVIVCLCTRIAVLIMCMFINYVIWYDMISSNII